MMELDSFVIKFKQLCAKRISATLNVEACDGITTVSLKAELGNATEADSLNVKRQRSPSYFRRRFERQEAKTRSESKFFSQIQAAEAFTTDEKKVSEAEKPDDILDEIKTEDILKNEIVAKCDTFLDGSNEEVSDEVMPVVEIGSTLNKSSTVKTDDVMALDISKRNAGALNDTTEIEKCEELNAADDTVLVHATASLRNAPFNRVEDDILGSISEIIHCKDHLRRNIQKVQFADIRNRPMRDRNRFMHEVDILINVNKSNLWEPARSYLWKNLGSSSWTLHDGTEVSLIRIHQK